MNIAKYLVCYLNALGVRYIFGVSGANIEDVFDAAVTSSLSLQVILAKHEFCAGCMADGYSRTSHSLGVVMTTSGGGSLNVVAALGESLASQQPVLAIIGLPPSNLEGVGAFQDASGLNHALNGEKLFSALASKYFHRVTSPEHFARHLQMAVEKALTPPFGTSILMIPKDIQLKMIPENPEVKIDNIKNLPVTNFALDSSVIEQCVNAHNDVLIIVGEGVHSMNAKAALNCLAEKLNAFVAVTPEGKSSYQNSNPRFVGVTGVAGHQSVIDTAMKVKTIIMIGTRFQLMSRAGLEKYLDSKSILYIHSLPSCYNFSDHSQPKHFLIGDVKNILQQMLNALPMLPEVPTVKGEVIYQHPVFIENAKKDPFNFENILNLFNEYIKDQDVIYVDAGNTGGAALHYLKEAGYFGIALGMGGMGYAIGASIGSCFESKNNDTWCFLGDGALLMHGMEIHTVVEHQLPLRFVIFNNSSHAMCYDRDLMYLSGKNYFNLFKKSYYGVGFSQMFPGLYSHDVNNIDELKNHLDFLENYAKPAILSLNVDYHEVPPFLPFLQQIKVKKL